MVSMEHTLLGDVPLGVQIVKLLGSSDNVAHSLYDGDYLYEFDIEVILRDKEARPKPFAHTSFPEITGYSSGEHPLLVGGNMIHEICGAIVELHVGEGEIPLHFYKGDDVDEGKVSVVVWLILLERNWDLRNPLYHIFHICYSLGHSLLHRSSDGGIKTSFGGDLRQGSSI